MVRESLSEDKLNVKPRKHIPGSGTVGAKAQREVQAWPAIERAVRRLVRLKGSGQRRGCGEARLAWWVESGSQRGL